MMIKLITSDDDDMHDDESTQKWKLNLSERLTFFITQTTAERLDKTDVLLIHYLQIHPG